MNAENPGTVPDSSSSIIFKRKRGRPRKDENQNQKISRIANILSMRNQTRDQEDIATVNGTHSHQETAAGHDIVGQRVTGIVEATFDAGYLLSVKIGNSETSLRGVVFKPGRYIPVSSENDVAPQIEMINRNAAPNPTEFHTPIHSSYRRGRGRGRGKNESRFSYSGNGSSPGNQLQIIPVVSNGVDSPVVETQPLVSQPAHLAACKPVNQTPTNQIKTDHSMSEGHHSEPSEQMRDSSPPLSVEPLQSIHSNFFNPSSSNSQNLREARAGKMTELLLAVQEKVIDKQTTDVQHNKLEHHQN